MCLRGGVGTEERRRVCHPLRSAPLPTTHQVHLSTRGGGYRSSHPQGRACACKERVCVCV